MSISYYKEPSEQRDAHYNSLLTKFQISSLKEARNDRISYLTIGRVWITMAVAFSITVMFPSWWTYLGAIIVIGSSQFALAVLMHEGSHGLLHSDRSINDRLAEWFCAFPILSVLKPYRPYHAKHHKFTELQQDPDLVLSKPFPISKASLYRKIFRDLSGIAGYRRYKKIFTTIWATPKNVDHEAAGVKVLRLATRLKGFWIWNIPLAIAMSLTGPWYAYLLFWIVPILTWYSLIFRLRNIAEHVAVKNNTGLDFARTTLAPAWYRWMIAPLNVNYHAEHHFFPWCPWYLLPQAHMYLSWNGNTDKMCIDKGYLQVLKNTLNPVAVATIH